MVRREPTADASLAAIFACSKLGMAIAAITRITATTINSSMSENPSSLGCFILNPHPPHLGQRLEMTSLTLFSWDGSIKRVRWRSFMGEWTGCPIGHATLVL